MKASELTGTSLDWAVAKCEGYAFASDGINTFVEIEDKLIILGHKYGYSPSTYWNTGGAIIEREHIAVFSVKGHLNQGRWAADLYKHQQPSCDEDEDELYSFYEFDLSYGETALIAAMRRYVTFKLGKNVDIPKEINNV